MLVYLSGAAGTTGGVLVSFSILRLNVWLLKGVEEPKEARVMEALRGLELARNWKGRSFED